MLTKLIKALVAAVAVLALLPSGAQARPYSQNDAIGAHLSSVRHCAAGGSLTEYNTILRNDSHRAKTFRVFEVQDGVKTFEQEVRVPRHTRSAAVTYVESGELKTITVTFRREVLVHRTVEGVCYA